ncbi:unnamed protein product [Sphagnum balticum]
MLGQHPVSGLERNEPGAHQRTHIERNSKCHPRDAKMQSAGMRRHLDRILPGFRRRDLSNSPSSILSDAQERGDLRVDE